MKSIHLLQLLKSRSKLILLFIAMLTSQISIACSCHNGFTICSLFEKEIDFVLVKVKVIEVVEHAGYDHSIFLEVEKNLRPEFALTDTIELVGGITAACHSTFKYLQPGEIRYMAINQPNNNVIDLNTIPVSSDTYWRHAPFLCGITVFNEVDDLIVGPISDDIRSYPKDIFDRDAENCQFKPSELGEKFCPTITIYPNPIIDNYIYFEDIGTNLINNVTIFTTNGQLVVQHEGPLEELELRLPEIDENLIIMEYYCGTTKHIEKLYVHR
ncbi:MAG: T9SS type A sorting domain-containing protein [Saprospiraceae bacterium]|nr:T9SS type A sorting domain-containing protein [Saprospiraceae bacterium]